MLETLLGKLLLDNIPALEENLRGLKKEARYYVEKCDALEQDTYSRKLDNKVQKDIALRTFRKKSRDSTNARIARNNAAIAENEKHYSYNRKAARRALAEVQKLEDYLKDIKLKYPTIDRDISGPLTPEQQKIRDQYLAQQEQLKSKYPQRGGHG